MQIESLLIFLADLVEADPRTRQYPITRQTTKISLSFMPYNVIELCAGGGGQALGLEMAGFHHAAAIEFEAKFCITLRRIALAGMSLNQVGEAEKTMSLIGKARTCFHRRLLQTTVTISEGIPSNADKASRLCRALLDETLALRLSRMDRRLA